MGTDEAVPVFTCEGRTSVRLHRIGESLGAPRGGLRRAGEKGYLLSYLAEQARAHVPWLGSGVAGELLFLAVERVERPFGILH